MSPELPGPSQPTPRRPYVRAVGPRLRLLLLALFGVTAALAGNGLYLAAITFLEWLRGDANQTYQNWFYMVMFGVHLGLGLLMIVPAVVFGVLHLRNARGRPNRRAVAIGYVLFVVTLAVLVSGVLLMRVDLFQFKNLGLKDPRLRSVTYWVHVIAPLLVAWLYVLHRLAGPRLRWRVGLRWGAVMAAVVAGMVLLHSAHPRMSRTGSAAGEKYFEPSLSRTASGKFIPARTLMMDNYCQSCHPDAYQSWFHSAHHFSSFNNPFYLFSVRETRQVSLRRAGQVTAARWCAGCHDPAPFFSGAFDDPKFDDVNDPSARVGITCTSCHAITHINSTKGNGDYTIDEPIHYPFAYSTNRFLQYLNQQLVKAKPEFHKQVFLKPFMRTAEFCSTCHKVSVPRELNNYKEFLRGQNHYDTYLLSGVSGHGARSFYYPDHAVQNCAGCHMPLQESSDFGANFFNPTNASARFIHSHLFPAANTALPYVRGEADLLRKQEAFLRGCVRVDIFGLREGGGIECPLTAPLRPDLPKLKPGGRYLFEVVLRTLRVGHPFTQGTVDSNEAWVDAQMTGGDRMLGRSGGLEDFNQVDPWAHFINVYMLDREGRRIDRRNPQDIFTPLYDHQILPGAAQVVHYEFEVPADQQAPLTFAVKLQYRKFDTFYVNYVFGTNYSLGLPLTVSNTLPIVTIAEDQVTFPIEGIAAASASPGSNLPSSPIPEWQRWNDYGIGLLLEGNRGAEKGELIQAAHAFAQVERLGQADGPLNLARVYYKEGRLEEAVTALRRAAQLDPPAPRWTVAWLTGLVNKQNGYLDQAITNFESILDDRYAELQRRGLDFSKDYEVINELGQARYERAKMERRDPARRRELLQQAADSFEKTLLLDPENLTAHYTLALIYTELGQESRAALHRREHQKYLPDYNAQDRAVTVARRASAAADHAAQATVLYPLRRPEASGVVGRLPAPRVSAVGSSP